MMKGAAMKSVYRICMIDLENGWHAMPIGVVRFNDGIYYATWKNGHQSASGYEMLSSYESGYIDAVVQTIKAQMGQIVLCNLE